MQQVRDIIEHSVCGMLATCDGDQPRVRPMAFVLLDDGRLWSSTYRQSGKAQELEHNARVEVCFVDSANRQVRVEGVVDTSGGPAEKKRLLELNPRVRKHFADERDERFVHLEVRPTRVRWKPTGFNEYNEVAVPARAEPRVG